MKENDLILFSSLIFMLGSLVLIFGAVLRNSYTYHHSFEDVLHVHTSVIWILLCGVVIAVIGLLGLIAGIFKHET